MGLLNTLQKTSGHGFHYWVTAGSAVERALWVGVVLAGFTAALILVSFFWTKKHMDVPKVYGTTQVLPSGPKKCRQFGSIEGQ